MATAAPTPAAAPEAPKAKKFDKEGTPYWQKAPGDMTDIPEGYEQDPSDGAFRKVLPD